MSSEIFYDGGSFQIVSPEIGDPTIWDSLPVRTLCEELANVGEAEKSYFFTKGLNRITERTRLPGMFIDPNDTFDPFGKCDSDIFRNIELYKGIDGEKIAEFIKKLIQKKVIVADEFKVFKCKCDNITIGSGNYCCMCSRNCEGTKKRKLFYLPSEIKIIFHSPGKIIEGVIYNILSPLSEKGLSVVTNYLFKEEGEAAREIDISVKDNNGKVLVMHTTINCRDQRERSIFEKTLKYNTIKTVFISTDTEKQGEGILAVNRAIGDAGVCLWDITKNNNFSHDLITVVKSYFNI